MLWLVTFNQAWLKNTEYYQNMILKYIESSIKSTEREKERKGTENEQDNISSTK